VSFNIDFDTAAGTEKITQLTAQLKKLTTEANSASKAMRPPDSSADAYKKLEQQLVAQAESIKKLSKTNGEAAKAAVASDTEKSSSVKAFVASLEKELAKATHAVAAFSGMYGKKTQAWMEANEKMKLSKKQLSEQVIASEKAEADAAKRSAAAYEQAAKMNGMHDSKRNREREKAHYDALEAVYKYNKKNLAAQREMLETAERMNYAHDKKRRDERDRAHYDALKAVHDYNKAKLDAERKALDEAYSLNRKHDARMKKLAEDRAAREAKSNAHTKALGANLAASARAMLSATGASFGIYTSKTIAVAAAVYVMSKALHTAVTAGIEFEKSMFRAFAVTGETGKAYEKNGEIIVEASQSAEAAQRKMTQAAIDASKATIFTASESAEGLVALGMSGLNAEKSMGSLRASLNLAAIGMVDVYTSADIMTNVMLGFGMEIDTYSKTVAASALVSDVLASSITNSNATIREMAKALSYVAPVAAAVGASIEETTAILETFHNVGIKGQRAGTSARRAFINLISPSDKVGDVMLRLGVNIFEASGKMRGMIPIMKDLKAAGASAADMSELFGARAAPAMIALLGSIEATEAEYNRLRDSAKGAAQEMALFMATSLNDQNLILVSKLHAKYQEVFEKSKGSFKDLNRALKDLIDNNIDGVFDGMAAGLKNSAALLTAIIVKYNELSQSGAVDDMFDVDATLMGKMFAELKKGSSSLALAINAVDKLGSSSWNKIEEYSKKATPIPIESFVPKGAQKAMDQMFDGVNSGIHVFGSLNKETRVVYDNFSNMTDESGAWISQQIELIAYTTRLKDLQKEYNDELTKTDFGALANAAASQASIGMDRVKSQEGLGLVSAGESFAQQISFLNEQEDTLRTENDRVQAEFLRRKTVNEEALLSVMFNKGQAKEIASEHAAFNTQFAAEMDKTIEIRQSLINTVQSGLLEEAGFDTLLDGLNSRLESIRIANEKLKGNFQAKQKSQFDQDQEAYDDQTLYVVAAKQARDSGKDGALNDDQYSALVKQNAEAGIKLGLMEKELELNHKLTTDKAEQKRLEKEHRKAASANQDVSDANKLVEALTVANEKLEGNKQASYEARLANLQSSAAIREATEATSEFNAMSKDYQKAHRAETEGMKLAAAAAGELIAINRQLTEAKKAHTEAVKLSKTFDDFDDLDKEITRLEVANAKLKGNTAARDDNTFAILTQAIAARELAISSGELAGLTAAETLAFTANTEKMKENIDHLRELTKENIALAEAKERAKDLGEGKHLSDEGKGTMTFLDDMKGIEGYYADRYALAEEYGMSVAELEDILVESKIASQEAYWDSQHEHLAQWKEDWSTAVGDNIAAAVLMEQHWSEAAKNIAAEVLGSMISTMAKLAAEKMIAFAMENMFSAAKVTRTGVETAAEVTGVVAVSGAKAAAAGVEAASSATTGSAGATAIGLLGTAAAAAAGPLAAAAMAYNVITFGAAGLAAAASMALNGLVTAAAYTMAGIGATAGSATASAMTNSGGGKALGGRVTKGTSYIVGEVGREEFIPDSDGYIMNHQDAKNATTESSEGAGNTITVINHYNIDATGNEDFEQRLNNSIKQAAKLGHSMVIQDFANNGQASKLAKRNARR
jgi:TP901 family phage tail tape measure protein